MAFHKFIEERGPPFRTCDIFDDVYAVIYEQLKREHDTSSTAVVEHIKELANQLLLNVIDEKETIFTNSNLILGKSITTTNVYAKSSTTSTIELHSR